jgi:chromosome segregation ATPase
MTSCTNFEPSVAKLIFLTFEHRDLQLTRGGEEVWISVTKTPSRDVCQIVLNYLNRQFGIRERQQSLQILEKPSMYLAKYKLNENEVDLVGKVVKPPFKFTTLKAFPFSKSAWTTAAGALTLGGALTFAALSGKNAKETRRQSLAEQKQAELSRLSDEEAIQCVRELHAKSREIAQRNHAIETKDAEIVNLKTREEEATKKLQEAKQESTAMKTEWDDTKKMLESQLNAVQEQFKTCNAAANQAYRTSSEFEEHEKQIKELQASVRKWEKEKNEETKAKIKAEEDKKTSQDQMEQEMKKHAEVRATWQKQLETATQALAALETKMRNFVVDELKKAKTERGTTEAQLEKVKKQLREAQTLAHSAARVHFDDNKAPAIELVNVLNAIEADEAKWNQAYIKVLVEAPPPVQELRTLYADIASRQPIYDRLQQTIATNLNLQNQMENRWGRIEAEKLRAETLTTLEDKETFVRDTNAFLRNMNQPLVVPSSLQYPTLEPRLQSKREEIKALMPRNFRDTCLEELATAQVPAEDPKYLPLAIALKQNFAFLGPDVVGCVFDRTRVTNISGPIRMTSTPSVNIPSTSTSESSSPNVSSSSLVSPRTVVIQGAADSPAFSRQAPKPKTFVRFTSLADLDRQNPSQGEQP